MGRAGHPQRAARSLFVLITLLIGARAEAITLTAGPTVTVGSVQVTVTWKTDLSGTTEVAYGPSSAANFAAYPNTSSFTSLAGLSHSRSLTLSPGTYFFRVKSDDGLGAAVESAEGSFTVLPFSDVTPISRYGVGDSPASSVQTLVRSGSTLWLGGFFTQSGPRLGSGLKTDALTGALLPGQPQVVGVINTVVPDGAGGFFIGGMFNQVGAYARGTLAHILPDGGVDPDWAATTNGRVSALAMYGSTLYVGGSFSTANGTPSLGLVAFDAATGTRLPLPSATIVEAMTVSGTTLFLGGNFSSVDGQPRNRVAAIDLMTGTVLPLAPSVNGVVYSLVAEPPNLYLGGEFTTVNSVSRARAAAVAIADGSLQSWDPNVPAGRVYALAHRSGNIYLGGDFTTVQGSARNHFAVVDTSGALQPTVLNASSPVRGLTLSGTTLYVVGGFSVFGGQARPGGAAVDLTSPTVLSWQPRVPETVYTVAVQGGVAYLGGSFVVAAGATQANLLGIDTQTDSVLPLPWSTLGNVDVLAHGSGTVFAGGSFAQANSQPRQRLAAFDEATGALLPWQPSANSTVTALTVSGTTVFLGGVFTTINGQTRNRAAAVDTSGTLLSFHPNLNGGVSDIKVVGTTVYLAGDFTPVGGQARSYVAAVDLNGTLLPWNPVVDGPVRALIVLDDRIYLGGLFTTVNGQPRSNAAAVDTSGALLAWNPSATSQVSRLARFGREVLVGGNFQSIGGASRRYLCAVDSLTGATLPWNPLTGSLNFIPVRALAADCAAGLVDVAGQLDAFNTVPVGKVGTFSRACERAPNIRTLAVTGPASTSATLSGEALSNGLATTGYFRLGTSNPGTCSDSFGTRVPASGGAAVSADDLRHTFSLDATGLSAGTSYYFCAAATNGAGTFFGAPLTFTTASTAGFVVSGYPSPSRAGTPESFTVTAVDGFGATITTYSGTVSFTSSTDTSATLPANTTLTNGTATLSATFFKTGVHSLTATDAAEPTLTGTQNGINIQPGPPQKFQLTGVPNTLQAGVATSPTVEVLDAYDNRATDYLGQVTFSSSDAAASLPSPTTFTAGDNGQRLFASALQFATPGTHWVTVTDGTLTFTLTNIEVTVAPSTPGTPGGTPPPQAPTVPEALAPLRLRVACGCQSGGEAASGWAFALLALALLRRARRTPSS